jgi:hypothetical protein
MSILPASSSGEVSTGFYNGDVEQSVRLFGTTAYFDKEFGTPTSQKKMIFAVWVKPSKFAEKQHIMGGGSGGTDYFLFSFSADGFYNTTDSLKFGVATSNTNRIYRVTNRVFRDPTNWTHICIAIDTTQATADNRIQMFFNGKRYTEGYSVSVTPSQDADIPLLNTAVYHQIGLLYAGANYGHFDGYMADFYFLDGQSIFSDTSATINSTFLADADTLGTFCEQKNGIGIPKAYTGATSTYGNNGFRLQFKNTTAGGTSPSTSTIGADTSGKTNHFNDYNAGTTPPEMQGNCLDNPENNFCTMKPATIDHQSRTTPSNGALEITNPGSAGWSVTTSTFSVKTGKWWFEACASGSIGIGYNVGFQNADTYFGATTDGRATGSFFYYGTTGTGAYYYVGTSDSGTVDNDVNYYTGFDGARGTTFVVGDVLGLALDLDSSPPTIQHYVNGSAGGPAIEIPAGNRLVPYLGLYSGSAVTTFNFGTDPTFGGITVDGTSADASDSNGQGKFYDTPPSGFLALCNSNLPDLTISPAQSTQATDYFNATIYTGDGQDDRQITQGSDGRSIGFSPDLVWIKNRSNAGNDYLPFDSNRGGDLQVMFSSGGYYAEFASTTKLSAFITGGFQLGANPHSSVNANSQTYVAQNWFAGTTPTATNSAGAGATPTAGSVKIDGVNKSDALAGTIPATKINANTTAGFSIVLYTGTGSAGTVAHGLNSAPDVVIIKNRTDARNWVFGNSFNGFQGQLYIGTTGAFSTNSGSFNNTAPSSTVVTVNTDQTTNESGDSMLMYCFHNVAGYCHIGGYTGNGSTDGPVVYTGFRPAFLLIKRTDSTNNWVVFDNARSPSNVVNDILFLDLSDAEIDYDRVDFLSMGFKLKDTGSGVNNSGGSFVYMAFAQQPFKFSNAL